MKRIKIFLGIAIVLLLLITTSCKKATELAGTKWKLEGIVNEKTGEMQVLEPVDCEECYTLTFETDYIATGHSISKEVHINLRKLKPLNMPDILELEEWNGQEYIEGDEFRRTLCSITSYTAATNELKLFYNHKNESLKFNLIQP